MFAAGDYSCAVLASGLVRCWGYNGWGQLGDGTTTDRALPVVVQGVSGATDLVMDDAYACALTDGGAVYCWGRNDTGQASGLFPGYPRGVAGFP